MRPMPRQQNNEEPPQAAGEAKPLPRAARAQHRAPYKYFRPTRAAVRGAARGDAVRRAQAAKVSFGGSPGGDRRRLVPGKVGTSGGLPPRSEGQRRAEGTASRRPDRSPRRRSRAASAAEGKRSGGKETRTRKQRRRTEGTGTIC